MESWLPLAVVAAALFVPMIAIVPFAPRRKRRRRRSERESAAPAARPAASRRARHDDLDDPPPRRAPPPPPRPAAPRETSPGERSSERPDERSSARPAEPPREPRALAPAPPPPPERRAPPPERAPVRAAAPAPAGSGGTQAYGVGASAPPARLPPPSDVRERNGAARRGGRKGPPPGANGASRKAQLKNQGKNPGKNLGKNKAKRGKLVARGARGRPAPVDPYARDPGKLDDWPQAGGVRETLEAFLDRWGVEDLSVASFARVESMRASEERAFAFVVNVEEGAGRAPMLVRVCAPDLDDRPPNRIWVTSYFDHIGERFREDVTKTPQHARGIIAVRDVPPDGQGRASVALDYEIRLTDEPYDDIRAEDVNQYKNLLNIMRMFA